MVCSLSVAKLLEGIFKRFGLNAIIAYATTGVVLGPMTGLIETGTEVDLILSIGIFIFFFLIGLEELDIRGFLSAIRGRLFLASVLSVTISLLVSLAVTTDTFFDLGLELDFTQALGLAGVLSLSSLGVVAKVLIDEGRIKEPVGVQIFTTVIIAELIALFVVGFAISEHFYAGGQGHTLDLLSVSTIIGQNHRIHHCNVVSFHEGASQGHCPPASLLAGAATLLWLAPWRALLGRRSSRNTSGFTDPWERCSSAPPFPCCLTRCGATLCRA